MSIKTWTGTALILAALSLTGCGGGANTPQLTSDPVDAATDSSPEPTATAAAAERSPRGALIKEVGEPGAFGQVADEWALVFTVTSVEVDPICTSSFDWPSVNGHMVALTIEASTAPAPILTEAGMTGASFSPHYWKAIAPNGTTANTVYSPAADNCFPQTEMLPDVGPGEKVVGRVVLDVPTPTGTLVFDYGDAWEWEYGAK